MSYKHRDIVIAYMDGKQIQMKRDNNTWSNMSLFDNQKIYFAFNNDREYRIKPEPQKYRVALRQDGILVLFDYSENKKEAEEFSKAFTFKRWLTDWVEYEV